jgi:hypothetical protein
MNGGINTGAELIPNLHIFGRIPTPYALVLQIRMEAFGKGVVLTRVADKAGVELEGLAKQRGQIVNQRIWQTTAPEKGQGERPRLSKGAMVEAAGTMVGADL